MNNKALKQTLSTLLGIFIGGFLASVIFHLSIYLFGVSGVFVSVVAAIGVGGYFLYKAFDDESNSIAKQKIDRESLHAVDF